MITLKNVQRPASDNFIRGCFMVNIGTQFSTYQQIMQYAQAVKVDEGQKEFDSAMNQILRGNLDDEGGKGNKPLPYYFSRSKCRDTSLGGNDAINPLPQFSVDDDIVHPHFETKAGTGVGMGRIYSENFDDTQQILYLGFGIPVFSNVGSFWASAVDRDMANFINKGSNITPQKIGYLLGAAPIVLIKIATIPFKFIKAITDTISTVKISKYYSFSSQMPMYFRFVNTILVHLATNMNMMLSNDDINLTGSETSDVTPLEQLKYGTKPTHDVSGMPDLFKDGLDMAQIMSKRYFYEHGSDKSQKRRNTDFAMFEAARTTNNGNGIADKPDPETSTNPDSNQTNNAGSEGTEENPLDKFWDMGWFDAFKGAYKDAIYDGHLFIGFRIDKGMGATESFSNQTGESQVAMLANEKFQQGRSVQFDSMGGNFGSGGIAGMMTDFVNAIKAVGAGVSNTFKLDPLAATLTGAAKVDIPEVWMGSAWSRSASFSITCLSPYGDVESIFMSEYVPLACILAGSLPRGTGEASHSAPFICQAYCRGMFSSPLCMIESLEVSRGADQYGFNMARLPLKLTMNVTLKDLTPAMYMSMGGDRGIAARVFGTDDNFGEYMLTLSGMGLRDRLAPFRSIRRKTQILLSTIYKNKLSPFMMGMEGGSRLLISRMVSTVTSGGRGLPRG
jgi:hypothetical protein